jgi:probable addiction module antidote protein
MTRFGDLISEWNYGESVAAVTRQLCGGGIVQELTDVWSINAGAVSMTKLTKSYQESLLAALQNPAEAAAYLNAALEGGDTALFLLALRNVAEAKGISHLATEAHLNRESLYRILSEQGNPQLSSLTTLLDALNLRLAVTVK